MSEGANYTLVLVAETQERALGDMVKVLRNAGYQAVGTLTFADARRQIALEAPKILITSSRLEAFNGMHLAHLARRRDQDCGVLIIGRSDERALEREVIQNGLAFVVGPVPPTVLPSLVAAVGGAPSAVNPIAFWRDPRYDRRRADRRQLVIPGYTPDRRTSDRRAIPRN